MYVQWTQCTMIIHIQAAYINTYINILSMTLQPYIMQLVCSELNESTHAFSTYTTAQKYQWTLHKLMSGCACVCGRARPGQVVRMRERRRESVQGKRTEHMSEMAKRQVENMTNGKLQNLIHMFTKEINAYTNLIHLFHVSAMFIISLLCLIKTWAAFLKSCSIS